MVTRERTEALRCIYDTIRYPTYTDIHRPGYGWTYSISLGNAVDGDGATLPRNRLQGGGITLDRKLPGYPGISSTLLVFARGG